MTGLFFWDFKNTVAPPCGLRITGEDSTILYTQVSSDSTGLFKRRQGVGAKNSGRWELNRSSNTSELSDTGLIPPAL